MPRHLQVRKLTEVRILQKHGTTKKLLKERSELAQAIQGLEIYVQSFSAMNFEFKFSSGVQKISSLVYCLGRLEPLAVPLVRPPTLLVENPVSLTPSSLPPPGATEVVDLEPSRDVAEGAQAETSSVQEGVVNQDLSPIELVVDTAPVVPSPLGPEFEARTPEEVPPYSLVAYG
ncbi:uncharacterized protein G2W53_004443 [Senna tora]|uniref:Uncharacterized protein n=1 Tax=Senna tora TaxID=362788 RepID=A0A835CJC8_9FABA|nr:uncharacterized protein G2W53_004443 [Senna tora]